jgi:ribosomal protein S18 acetylase RimI-like enzyme
MPVRPLEREDIPQIAELYWTISRARKGPAPPAVRTFLEELYFTNPWMDSALPSLVYDEKKKIAGFLGVVPRRMLLNGQPVRIAYGGNFAVHPEFRNTLAGLHLLRTYMAGKQDLSQTDSANDTSRALLERLGFTTILPFCMHWVRLLRPTHCVTHAMSRLSENPFFAGLQMAARPFSAVMDWAVSGVSSSPFHFVESPLKASELDIDTLLGCVEEFRGSYSLWPEYDPQSLNWLLNFMERWKGHGEGLRKVVLRDDAGAIVGWYIYYRSPGGYGEVVQLGGARKKLKDILDHLFFDAWKNGAIALHGTIDRRLMDDFSSKYCFFTCRGGWTVAHSNKPKFLDLLNSGDAFISRLDGEWCLAFGG